MRVAAILVVIAALFLPPFFQAQPVPERLLLVVHDPTGASVADAYVQVQHWLPATTSAKAKLLQDGTGTTDGNGEGSFALPSGHYEVFVSSPYFLPAAAHVFVRRGAENRCVIMLPVGSGSGPTVEPIR